jgi:hypothetical protein
MAHSTKSQRWYVQNHTVIQHLQSCSKLMHNVMVWRKSIFSERLHIQNIECSMQQLFGWAIKTSYKCLWMITWLHTIIFNNSYLNVFISLWDTFIYKAWKHTLNLWLMKIHLIDTVQASSSVLSNAVQVFELFSNVQLKCDMRDWRKFYRLFLKNYEIKIQGSL